MSEENEVKPIVEQHRHGIVLRLPSDIEEITALLKLYKRVRRFEVLAGDIAEKLYPDNTAIIMTTHDQANQWRAALGMPPKERKRQAKKRKTKEAK